MSDGVFVLIVFALSFIVYFIPTMIAWDRGHKNTAALFALNILLGWTFLGWAAALVWALMSQDKRKKVVHDEI